jgi:hypothetical protein
MRTRIVHHLLDNPEHHLRMRTRAGQLTAARIEIVETDVLQITCNAIESHRPGDVDISRPYRPRGFEHRAIGRQIHQAVVAHRVSFHFADPLDVIVRFDTLHTLAAT